MAKRKAKRTAKQSTVLNDKNTGVDSMDEKEPRVKTAEDTFTDPEVERQIAATEAIADVEANNLLTQLRLLRSCYNEDQLQTPALQFFRESLPNVKIIGNGKDVPFDLHWKEGAHSCMIGGDTGDFHATLLHHMTMAYPDCPSGLPSFSGFQFSSKAGKQSLAGADGLLNENYVTGEPSSSQMPGMPNEFQTPGANSQRLSMGITPKTLRHPKQGEMLLSVHGSPLGVYKEDSMNAISEVEEG